MLIKPLGLHVVMLVHRITEIGIPLCFLPVKIPRALVAVRQYIRPGGADQLHLRVFCMDRLLEHPVSLVKIHLFCLPLFIPNAHHGKAEGLRMSHPGPKSAPEGIRRAVGKLNQIQRVLHKLPKSSILHGNQLIGLILASQPHVQHRQGLSANQLTQKNIPGQGFDCSGNKRYATRFRRLSHARPSG